MRVQSKATVHYYDVETFTQKHREMDLSYYGKPYDDQDKYQLVLQGEQREMLRFVSGLKQERPHPYIQFGEALIEVHVRKVSQLSSFPEQSYPMTLYHVGSRYGQKQELTGWLNWIAAKKEEYPELGIELQFSHLSTPDLFILKTKE